MKCLIFLSVALVLFSAAFCKHQKHHIDHHKRAEQEKWLTKAKATEKPGECKLVCNGVEAPPGQNVTKYPDGSWSYEIQLEHNFHLQVGFNKTTDFLIIFNPILNLLWTTNGQLIGVFNLTSNALMLIDTTQNIFNIIPNVGGAIINGTINALASFDNLINLVIQNSVNLVAQIGYSIDGFFTAIRENTLNIFFHANITIFNVFKLSFSFYMNSSLVLDGFNMFLRPIVGVTEFGLDIFNKISAGITYGTQLTFGAVSFIFVGMAQITLAINNLILGTITGTIEAGVNLGLGLISGIINFPGTLFNILTGSIQIEGGGGIYFSSGTNSDHGFVLNFGNETDGNYSVNCNATHNSLGFYNDNLKLVMVADGTTGMYLIFNISSSDGLIVNSTGNAKVVTKIQLPSQEVILKLDVGSKFALISNILRDNQKIDISDEFSFDFKGYFKAYLEGNNFFTPDVKKELQNILGESFGELFTLAKENNGAELFSKFGVAVMFNAVYGKNVIGENFAQLMDSLYADNNGRFSVKLMKQVYDKVQENIRAGGRGFLKYIFEGMVKNCIGGKFSIFGIISIGSENEC